MTETFVLRLGGLIQAGGSMQLVLVSACLLGQPVRYDGCCVSCQSEILDGWVREQRVVPFCPEMAGGLPAPRAPAEIERGAGGDRVLSGAARVLTASGLDVSAHFIRGAEEALSVIVRSNIRLAVLKENSPSCGSSRTYDGTFSGQRVSQSGVTAALLRQCGVRVFSEDQLAQARLFLDNLAATGH